MPPTPPRFALLALGFRPFYLLASAFAALSILLWIAGYAGFIGPVYRADPVWHAHEMLYGYTIAVIVGFLFTAGRNWSGQPTPTGAALAALAVLWIVGRVLVLTPYTWSATLVNAAFPILSGLALARALVRGRNRRNYFFAALLIALGLLTLAVHLSRAGVFTWPARAGVQVGLDAVLFIMAVMGGRVIPMFTNNGIPGLAARRTPWVERVALGSVIVLALLDLAQAHAVLIASVAVIAGCAHAVRLALWQPWRTLSTPLVWVLHAAYAWIPIHLVLRAFAQAQLVAEPLATHALTIGAIGGLTIGMMTRTARGHTGRPLVADRFEVACYVLVQLAALLRVFGGMALGSHYVGTVLAAGACWSTGFALYAVRYWPVLSRPRLDGKPG
jgi:uncharacterized protein involved in response to NO